jgi:hypothetical protein
VENGEILLVKMLVGVENGEWEKVRNGRRGCRSCRSRLFGRSSVANKRSAASGDSGSYSLILTFFYSFQGAAAGPEKRTKEQFRTSRRAARRLIRPTASRPTPAASRGSRPTQDCSLISSPVPASAPDSDQHLKLNSSPKTVIFITQRFFYGRTKPTLKSGYRCAPDFRLSGLPH